MPELRPNITEQKWENREQKFKKEQQKTSKVTGWGNEKKKKYKRNREIYRKYCLGLSSFTFYLFAFAFNYETKTTTILEGNRFGVCNVVFDVLSV